MISKRASISTNVSSNITIVLRFVQTLKAVSRAAVRMAKVCRAMVRVVNNSIHVRLITAVVVKFVAIMMLMLGSFVHVEKASRLI